jgi:hypothetical protein
MREQHDHHAEQTGAGTIALITDSSCDLPIDYLINHQVRLVPVTITFGTKTYMDRINITADEVYRMMDEEHLYPTTSQPTPASFRKAYAMAAEHHDHALAIYLSSAMSGTYQAGLNAAAERDDLEVRVVDSKTTAGALGLLVKVAADAIAAGCDLDEVHRRVREALPHCRLYVAFRDLEHVIRGGRVGRIQGWLAKLLNLVPILSFGTDGKPYAVGKSRPGRRGWRKVVDLIIKRSAGLRDLHFLVCHAMEPEGAQFMADALCEAFDLDSVDILQVSPTVGAHVGLGTCAIAMYGLPAGGSSSP